MRVRLVLAALCALGAAHAGPAPNTVVDADARYPEGALWWDGRLHYAEMGADQVVAISSGRKRIVWREDGCGPTALAPYGAGLLVLCHRTAQLVALDGEFRVTRRWLRDDAGVGLQNPNDATADGAGGVYFSDPGAFSAGARATGAVLHLSADGGLRRVAQGLHYANGVYADRAERALYVDEHLRRRVLRYSILADGGLGPVQVFADLDAVTPRVGTYPEAGPDGLERGPDGDLYVCLYGEGRIVRLSRDGRLVASIPVATPYLTNIAFAPDGSAYVTGAFENVRAPLRGQVARLDARALSGAAAPRR